MSKHPHWLSQSQFGQIRPHLPGGDTGCPHSVELGRRAPSGIIHVLQSGVH